MRRDLLEFRDKGQNEACKLNIFALCFNEVELHLQGAGFPLHKRLRGRGVIAYNGSIDNSQATAG